MIKDNSKTIKEFNQSKDIYLANGYSIVSETDKLVNFKKNNSKVFIHILLLLIFGLFTFGIINVIYYYMSIETCILVKPNLESTNESYISK